MRFIVFLVAVSLLGCESKPKETAPDPAPAKDAGQVAEKPNDNPQPTPVATTGPTVRIAAPHKLLQMRMDQTKPIGNIVVEDSEPQPLEGFGLNRCQTGFVFQGYYKEGDKLVSTPHFNVQLGEVPLGRAFVYDDPMIETTVLKMNVSAFDLDNVKGVISLNDAATGVERMKMTLDGPPTTVATAPGVGPMGCYTTGYYLADGKQGPVVAVWDGNELFYVGIQLTENRSLTVEFAMRGGQRRPENMIQASLKRVFEKPDRFPFRVNFEKRFNAEPVYDKTGPQLSVQKTPVESGNIRAAFRSSSPNGPIRIELENITIPPDHGELSGKTVNFKVEAEFVSDLKGRLVPVPIPPQWKSVAGD